MKPKNDGAFARLARKLSIIPMMFGALFLGGILLMMQFMIYTSAYLFPIIGAGLFIFALLTSHVGWVFVGVMFAGVGGLSYIMWFTGVRRLPTLTEWLDRLANAVKP